MKIIAKTIILFSIIVLSQGCRSVEAMLERGLFKFSRDIVEEKKRIPMGRQIDIDKNDFYVLKMAERAEIQLTVNNKTSYADLPFKKYIPVCKSDTDSIFITEETYLYLHDFDTKNRERTGVLNKPIDHVNKRIFNCLDSIFEYDLTTSIELNKTMDDKILDFYNHRMLKLAKLRKESISRDSIFRYQNNLLNELLKKIDKIEDIKTTARMKQGFRIINDHDSNSPKSISLKNDIESIKSSIDSISIAKNEEISGIAAYFITYPYRDSSNLRKFFNQKLNGNHLVLDAVRHLRIGYWSKRGNDVYLYFKHKDKLVAFQGKRSEDDAFLITKGSHPAMQKHYSSKVLHFMDINSVLDLGKLEGLPFYPMNPKRRLISYFSGYTKSRDRKDANMPDLNTMIASEWDPDTTSTNTSGRPLGSQINQETQSSGLIAPVMRIGIEPYESDDYPNIEGFLFSSKKVKDKWIPQLHFTDEVVNSLGVTERTRFFRYEGVLSILTEKEFGKIKDVNQ